MTDQSILASLSSGEDTALHVVYRQYRTPCLRFLLGRVIPRDYPNRNELAAELFTESLIILVQNVRSGRLTALSARLDTYLNAVARNLFRKLQRRGREEYRAPGDLPPPLVEAADHFDPDATRKELYASMNQLGTRCRQLLVHFYFLDLDWTAIAEVLGYKNADSAKTNKAKCMKRLRALYGVTKPSNQA